MRRGLLVLVYYILLILYCTLRLYFQWRFWGLLMEWFHTVEVQWNDLILAWWLTLHAPVLVNNKPKIVPVCFLPLSVCARKRRSWIIWISVHSCRSSCWVFSLTRSFFKRSSSSSLLTIVFEKVFTSRGDDMHLDQNVTVRRDGHWVHSIGRTAAAWFRQHGERKRFSVLSRHCIIILNVSYVTSLYFSVQ